MGKLLNNDTNYRIVAGAEVNCQPVGLNTSDGKIYPFKSGGNLKYLGWVAQKVAAGEVAAVIRNGKIGGVSTEAPAGSLVTVDSSGDIVAATDGGIVVGFVPFGGVTGREPVEVFIVAGYTLPAASKTALGGVKQAIVADSADVATLITALKTAGIVVNS